ncbi:unnamed protein product [Linum trigynum]|uniref:Uncharacterized protein n=1 Tax=Linum trigynum TaxID=586398 RepID=A0AAV2G9F8_9ROSI
MTRQLQRNGEWRSSDGGCGTEIGEVDKAWCRFNRCDCSDSLTFLIDRLRHELVAEDDKPMQRMARAPL